MGTEPSYFKGDRLPISYVNWYEAVEFCNKLSTKSGFSKCYTINGKDVICDWNSNGWRLPTEAEWEYACKAGTTSDLYNGNILNTSCNQLDTILDKIGWYCGNSNNTVYPVGRKAPNKFGLYDMSGNVSEWCWDWYGAYSKANLTDPKGDGSNPWRIIRGGSYSKEIISCISSCRTCFFPDNPFQDVGFRICRNN